jgi:hypothetical protein
MKIFLAMPHFIKRHTVESEADAPQYASHTQDPKERIPSFLAALKSFVSMFPTRNIELMHNDNIIGSSAARYHQNDRIEISICTSGDNHILDLLPDGIPENVRQVHAKCHPMHLGFECHKQMINAYKGGDYDYFVYSEDDIALFDRDIFKKITWFERTFGTECILNPNRYEIPFSWNKIYVDGSVPKRIYGKNIERAGEVLVSLYEKEQVNFVRHENPMSGCFFLTRQQMSRMVDEPSFGAPSEEILSYLETAQILPLVRQFKVYKPTLQYASFAEVQHTGTRLSLTPASRATLALALK